MKKALNIFFVVLGVIFFVIILIGVYLFVTDPLNLKPLFMGTDSAIEMTDADLTDAVDKHPAMSPAQEKALETVGIDPASVPTEITAEQEECFVEALGAERVAEIAAGDSPSAIEIIKAKGCI